jgi:hypothetical protein
MSNNLYGEQYDSCSPVAQTVSITLQHLTIDGKTLAGEQADYSSFFSGGITEKFLLLIKAPLKYTLWFDYDYNKKDANGVKEPNGLFEGLIFNVDDSSNANCEILPMFVDDDGNPIRVFAVFKIYRNLNYDANSGESWRTDLFNFLKQHLYLLDSIVDDNNNDLKSDLIYFEQSRDTPEKFDTYYCYASAGKVEQALSRDILKRDAYFSCIKEADDVSYKRFVSLRYCLRFACNGNKVYKSKVGDVVTTETPSSQAASFYTTFYEAVASVNEKTILAGTYDDYTEIEASDLTTPSAYIINSLGETFFSKFENARKIQNLAGQSVGTDKVLRPMMYIISQS